MGSIPILISLRANAAGGPARAGIVAVVGALAMAGALFAQQSTGAPIGEGIRLAEILTIAEERSPRLAVVAATARAAAARAPEASTFPDPMLQLGIMNFGLPELNADMPNSMAPAVQVMQRLPFPGKLGLRGEIADQATEIAEASAREVWWEVRSAASALFYDLYALDQRILVMRETLGLLEDFRTAARSLYEAGAGRQADVLRADVEVARMDGEIQRMEAMRRTTAARLNGLLDRPAETPVPTPILDPLPSTLPPSETLEDWAEESRPLLLRARLGVDQAGVRTELARREIWPDLTVGLQYGQRGGDSGTRRMGSVMVGFSLPLHASSRQEAFREEAEILERAAEADFAGLRAVVGARIGELLAELDRARGLITLYRGEIIPEARATVESAFSSYRVGTVDFLTLVDAQTSVNRFEGELHQLVADYGKALSALESSVGRPLPITAPIVVELR